MDVDWSESERLVRTLRKAKEVLEQNYDSGEEKEEKWLARLYRDINWAIKRFEE